MKLASFNIDVDPVDCYFDIHGLKPGTSEDDPIWSKGVVRFLDLFEKHGIKATFFITASDLDEDSIKVLKLIADKGHEIGNHTYSHDYRLTLLDKNEIENEIRKNHDLIKKMSGYECTGFRSPGYNMSPEVVGILKDKGYSYDSSFFPSPVYYLAKWLIIKIKKLRKRVSKSIIYSLMDCFGRKKPYKLGKSIRKTDSDSDLFELPITTVTPAGLPLIGTSAIVFPEFVYDLMLRISSESDFINFEAHGIDLCQAEDDEKLTALKSFQPDLKHSLERKLSRMEKFIKYFKSEGFEFRTLREITEIYRSGE